MLLKLAWRNIWRNRTRSFITIASILVAVLLANVMQSIQQGMWAKLLGTTMSFTGYIQVHADGFWEEQILDNSLEESNDIRSKIEGVENVSKVTPRVQSFALSAHKDLSRFVQIIGLNPELEEEIIHLKSKLAAGTILKSNENAILIGKGVAAYFDLNVGDTLSLIGQGYHGQSANGNFVVKGFFKYGNPEINSRMIIMPFKTAQRHFGAENLVTAYNVYLEDVDEEEETAANVISALGSEKYEVMTWQEMMPELEQAFQADTGGNVIFLFVLYLIISFGIFGTVLMMVAERQYEFGVLVSVGMRRFKLIIIIVYETMLLAIFGILAGIIVSLPIMYYLKKNPISLGEELSKAMEEYGFEAVIVGSTDPKIMYYNGIAVLIICMLILVYPAFVVSKLNPIKAMKK